MNLGGIILLIAASAVLLALAGFLVSGYVSLRLQRRLGSEYGLALQQGSDVWHGDVSLGQAERQVRHVRLRPLDPRESARFCKAWRALQSRFADDPHDSLAEADSLVREVMAALGYPVVRFEQSAADVAADHPLIVRHYRAAHAVCLQQAARSATVEEQRQAMLHYRALFEQLLRDASAVSLSRAS